MAELVVATLVSLLLTTSFARSSVVTAQAVATGEPNPWERSVGNGSYENRGIGRIEAFGSRWMLTILCDGTHSTYLTAADLNLRLYRDDFVAARYHYVEQPVDDPRCLQAPCGPSERVIALERLTRVQATAEDARNQTNHCSDHKEK